MIIGVDVGTSMTKAAVFDRNGRTLLEEDAPSRLNRLPGAKVEQDLDDVVGTVATVVGRVAAKLSQPPTAIARMPPRSSAWIGELTLIVPDWTLPVRMRPRKLSRSSRVTRKLNGASASSAGGGTWSTIFWNIGSSVPSRRDGSSLA